MGILYVVGERPGAGATAVAAGLTALWRKQGHRVVADKPAALDASAGGGLGAGADCDVLAGLTGRTADPPLAVGRDGVSDVLLSAAADRVLRLASEADAVIVEGLPREDAEGTPVAASTALAERLGARVLGVAAYRRALGPDDASRWRDSYASFLAGVVVNRRTVYAEHDARSRLVPAFEEAGVRVVGVVAEQRLLLAPTVSQVAGLLEGTFYAGLDGAEQLIEHFLIGGLIAEWGGNYFGRLPNQAVIVRGGRIDIQMAALNFPLNGLFLTACDTPPQYVYQRALEQDVPLVTVALDTHAAAAALEQLQDMVSIGHPEKIDHIASVLADAVDTAALEAAAGLS